MDGYVTEGPVVRPEFGLTVRPEQEPEVETGSKNSSWTLEPQWVTTERVTAMDLIKLMYWSVDLDQAQVAS